MSNVLLLYYIVLHLSCMNIAYNIQMLQIDRRDSQTLMWEWNGMWLVDI